MRVIHATSSLLLATVIAIFSGEVRAGALYSVADLGSANPSAAYLSGHAPSDSSGNYLTALSPAQRSVFQATSFDVFAHPAATSLAGMAFYPASSGYDVVNQGTSDDQLSRFSMTTSNNLGASAGTAAQAISSGDYQRLVIFTPDPHAEAQAVAGLPPVQSPGMVATITSTRSDQMFQQFFGVPSGINDHNVLALTETQQLKSGTAVLAPFVYGLKNSAGFPTDQNLGSLGGGSGVANALNNANQVVGWSQIAGGAQHAFLYSNHTMQDLNLLIPPLSGITLSSAVGIDATGQIVAYGTLASGQTHEFLLTPLEAPVAEPGTLAVFGIGIIVLAVRGARAGRSQTCGR